MATLIEDRHITDEERKTLAEDGALCLRGVVSEDWLKTIDDGIEAAMADPSDVAKEYGETGRFYTDHSMWQRFEQFRSFAFDSPMARLAGELMSSKKVNLYDEHLLIKEPGTETPTWWHHDLPYFRIKGSQIISFWIPLDPVTEETGSVRFAVGSHRWGKLFRPVKIGQGGYVANTEQFDETVPDIDGDPERQAKYGTVLADMAALQELTRTGMLPGASGSLEARDRATYEGLRDRLLAGDEDARTLAPLDAVEAGDATAYVQAVAALQDPLDGLIRSASDASGDAPLVVVVVGVVVSPSPGSQPAAANDAMPRRNRRLDC